MYCLQKPDFEVLLLAELQRQQQCHQLCDVLLKAKDASVSVHSCILSALNPSIHSALSPLPPSPAGQKWLLDLPTLNASTLFHLVSLCYTGRMTGVAENEKWEAISAAAKLGIHGLVEVSETDGRRRAGLCRHKEAEVQTEPQRSEGDKCRRGRWRREEVEGNTYLWRETLPAIGKEVWTQTEETNTAPFALPLASFEAVEVGAFQNVTQADYHQCVPVAVFCPPKDNQPHQLSSSTPPAGAKKPSHSAELVQTGNTPHLSDTPEPRSGWTGSLVEEEEDEDFEHFQGNIPGFINYFVNKGKKEDGGHGGRGRRWQRGASAAPTGQQRVRRPRGRPRGARGQRTCTQLVDMHNVKISKLQKMFLHRWGVKTPRAGQGGGTVGKKLCLKTRDDLTPTRRQRGGCLAWELSEIKSVQLRTMGRERNAHHQQKSLQETQTQVSRNKPSSVSVQPSSSSTRPLQTWSAAPHATAASPILHTTPLPPPPSPPEVQPKPIELLLEEVMMELIILPNNNNTPTQQQVPHPTSSNTSDSSQTQTKQQDPLTGSEVPVLQQQFEGELHEILDNFLHSFEQHDEIGCVSEASEASNANASDAGQPRTIQSTQIQTRSWSDPREQEAGQLSHPQAAINGDRLRAPQQQLEQRGVPAAGDVCSKDPKKTPKKTRKGKRAKTYLFSLERRVQNKEKNNAEAKSGNGLADDPQKQRKTRIKSVPSQEHSCKSLEKKDQNSLPPGKCLCDHASRGLKVYPIRSKRTRVPSEELPPAEEAPPAEQGHRSGSPRKRAQPLFRSNEEHKEETVQLDSASHFDNQAEGHDKECEKDFTMLPLKDRQEQTTSERKREVAFEETSHTSTISKRPCIDQTTQPSSPASGSEDLSSAEQDEVIDVETVSLTSKSDYLQETKLKVEGEWRQVISTEMTCSDNDIIDVEED